MIEFTKSLFSFSLAMSLFSVKQIGNLLQSTGSGGLKSPATRSFESLAAATTDQFGETLRSAFRAADNIQRGLIGLTFSLMFPLGGRGTHELHDRGVVPSSEPQRWTEVMERRTGTR